VSSEVKPSLPIPVHTRSSPGSRLDPAVYHVIGQAYQHIERLEPFLAPYVFIHEVLSLERS
jgi:hypothetical protein